MKLWSKFVNLPIANKVVIILSITLLVVVDCFFNVVSQRNDLVQLLKKEDIKVECNWTQCKIKDDADR